MTRVSRTILNDSYRTAVVLMHPPHMLALAALFMASVTQRHDLRDWFASLNADMTAVCGSPRTIFPTHERMRVISSLG